MSRVHPERKVSKAIEALQGKPIIYNKTKQTNQSMASQAILPSEAILESQAILESEEKLRSLGSEANQASEGIRTLKRSKSIFDKITYNKFSFEYSNKSEKENRHYCFVYYLISEDKRTLYIFLITCNGKSGEGSELLLALLNDLKSERELNSRATIELIADAEAASFFVLKDMVIDQKKLEEFYKKIAFKQINEGTPEFSAYVGKVEDAIKRRESKKRDELILSQSILQSSMQDPRGGKRTRKFRKIKKRKYRKSTGKLIRFSSR